MPQVESEDLQQIAVSTCSNNLTTQIYVGEKQLGGSDSG